jgi:hypothetical protein
MLRDTLLGDFKRKCPDRCFTSFRTLNPMLIARRFQKELSCLTLLLLSKAFQWLLRITRNTLCLFLTEEPRSKLGVLQCC